MSVKYVDRTEFVVIKVSSAYGVPTSVVFQKATESATILVGVGKIRLIAKIGGFCAC